VETASNRRGLICFFDFTTFSFLAKQPTDHRMKERESTIDSPLIITEEQKNKATNESADSTVSCSTVEFRLTVKKGVSFSIFTAMAVIVVKGKGAGGTKSKGLPYHIIFLHRFA
jgi:hypothetical protein